MQPDEPRTQVTYSTSLEAVPVDLEAEARDADGNTCHVCEAPAAVVAELLGVGQEWGSVVGLCDEDLQLVRAGDVDALSHRFASSYEESLERCAVTARAFVVGVGRAAHISPAS